MQQPCCGERSPGFPEIRIRRPSYLICESLEMIRSHRDCSAKGDPRGKNANRRRPAFRLLIEEAGKVGWNAGGGHCDISRRIAITGIISCARLCPSQTPSVLQVLEVGYLGSAQGDESVSVESRNRDFGCGTGAMRNDPVQGCELWPLGGLSRRFCQGDRSPVARREPEIVV